eukprot:m.287014 g.287014  ORF g.287014 m.287014 type:complete len:974 (+) comp55006_c0_seq2:130-3051(+)
MVRTALAGALALVACCAALTLPATCPVTSRLDAASISCVPCPTPAIASPSGIGCVCPNGYRQTNPDFAVDNGVLPTCVACPANMVSSLNGRACVFCTGSAVYSATTQTCSCPFADNTLVDSTLTGDYLGNITCATCASGFTPSATTPNECSSCSTGAMITQLHRPCTCGAGLLLLDGQCIPQSLVDSYTMPPSATSVFFSTTGVTVASQLLARLFQTSYLECLRTPQNLTACQVLGNMCVLQQYDRDSEICKRYLQVMDTEVLAVNGWAEWPQNLPWLYYDAGTAALSAVSLKMKASFSSNPDGDALSRLSLIAATFDVYGRFLGFVKLVSQLQVCSGNSDWLSSYLMFGTQFTNKCKISLNHPDIQRLTPLVFYDIYLQDVDGSLYPVPILNQNYVANNRRVNAESDALNWQLTRRLFLFDNMTGIEVGSSSPRIIRLATSVSLLVSLQNGATDGSISSPMLVVSYQDMLSTSTEALDVRFEAQYKMDIDAYVKRLVIACGVFAGVTIVWFIVTILHWRRRDRRVYIDFKTVVKTLDVLLGTFSFFLVWILIIASLYWLIFFKGQSTVYLLLPLSSQDDLFGPLLNLAFWSKLFQVLLLIYEQTNVDVFLIDWEKPRVRAAESSTDTLASPPVSIWRTYLIANEWNELQSFRKIDVKFLLFAVLFFLVVADALALSDVNDGNKSASTTNYINSSDGLSANFHSHHLLRFAVISFLFLCVGIGQYIWHILDQRFGGNALGDFTDLCSIANISVFILSHSLAGHYVHGRSVHGYADTDMKSMRDQLKKESEELTAQRGLEPNTEQQTFEIHIPPSLRDHFDTVYNNVAREDASQREANRATGQTQLTDRMIFAYATINRFLCAFLEHTFGEIDYLVQNKPVLARVLDLTPSVYTRGVFYRDSGHSFDQILFYGHEMKLFLLDLLLFAFTDYYSTNVVLAAVITYLVDKVLSGLRNHYGRKNIARKTLVDARFLI